MTKLEGAIITAYTGIMVCSDFLDVHEYMEKIMERPVWTHEIPMLADEIKKASEEDFMNLIKNQKG